MGSGKWEKELNDIERELAGCYKARDRLLSTSGSKPGKPTGVLSSIRETGALLTDLERNFNQTLESLQAVYSVVSGISKYGGAIYSLARNPLVRNILRKVIGGGTKNGRRASGY